MFPIRLGSITVVDAWIRAIGAPLIVLGAAVDESHLSVAASVLLPSTIDGDPGNARLQGAFIRLSPGGALVTARAYRPGLDNMFFAAAGSSDGVFLTGFVTLPGEVGGFGWAAKLDRNGAPIWERRIGRNEVTSSIVLQAAAATRDGGVVAFGGTGGGGPTEDLVLVKFSGAGSLLFARRLRNLPSFMRLTVTETPGGDIVACGGPQAGLPSSVGVIVCRFDANGQLRFQKNVPGLGDPRSAASVVDESVTVAAIGPGGLRLVVLDEQGSVTLSRQLDVTAAQGVTSFAGTPHAAGATADGGMLVSTHLIDRWRLFRLDAGGQLEWGREVAAEVSVLAGHFVGEFELTDSFYCYAACQGTIEDRGVPGGLLALRLTEDGNVGENGCGLLTPLQMLTTDAQITVEDASIVIDNDAAIPVNDLQSEVQALTVTQAMLCQQDHSVSLRPPFGRPPLRVCIEEDRLPLPDPPLPEPGPWLGRREGSLLAPFRFCHDDPGCLRCLQRLDTGDFLPNPGWRAAFYRSLRPFVQAPDGRIPAGAAADLLSALERLPKGELFDQDALETLAAAVGRWQAARAAGQVHLRPEDRLQPSLRYAANLLDLDLLLPRSRRPERGEDGSLGVGSLIRIRRAPAGLAIRVARDAPASLPAGSLCGWPFLVWEYRPDGREKDLRPYVAELSYANVRFDARQPSLRLLHWADEGTVRRARDITTEIDRTRRTVVGEAAGPGWFAIVDRRAGTSRDGRGHEDSRKLAPDVTRTSHGGH